MSNVPVPVVIEPKQPLSVPDLETRVLPTEPRSLELHLLVNRYDSIQSEKQQAEAGDLIKALTVHRAAVDAERDSWVRPLNEQVKRFNDKFRPVLTEIDEDLKFLRARQKEFMVLMDRWDEAIQEDQRRDRERKALLEAERIEAEARVERERLGREAIHSEALAEDARRDAEKAREAGLRSAELNLNAKAEQLQEESAQAVVDSEQVEAKAEEKVQQVLERAQPAPAPLAPAPRPLVRGSVSTTGRRKTIQFEILDQTKLPQRYLKPDMESLTFEIKTRKEGRMTIEEGEKIGIRIYEDFDVRNR